MSEKIKNSILYGLLNSSVGIGVGIYVAMTSIGEGYGSFPVTAGLASFLSAFAFRLIFTESNKSMHFVIIGVLTVVIAHYLTFYLELIRANICFHIFNSCKSSLGEAPMNLLQAVWGSAIFSFMSLLFYGWITIPAGIAISYFYRKNRSSKSDGKEFI